MPHAREDDRLSSGDALFLHLEREGMPLNVASVSIFDGIIPLNACRRFIESKVPQIPRYHQRIMTSPFNLGLPRWEDDPEFDIRNHVTQVTLKTGTDAELKKIAGQVLSKVMDRSRPLWDFTLVQGLKKNRTAIITRMHHCLADGLAGVSLLTAVMDERPDAPPNPKPDTKAFAAHRPQPPTLLNELITSSLSLAQQILVAQREVSAMVEHALAPAGDQKQPQDVNKFASNGALPSPDQWARYMPELGSATQPLPFNMICRGPQKFAWAEIPLAEVKAVKNAFGATVNEVVLTIFTDMFRRYSEIRGVNPRGRLLRVVVPVNIRGGESASHLGNRITFLPVSIPLGIRNAKKLLKAIQQRTAFLKNAHVAECVGLFGTVLGTLPTAAQMLIAPIVSQLPLGLCNTICTNVPGPQLPLYLLGRKLIRCYPYVPIGGDIGINCALLTYDGVAHFGFTGDSHAAPDLRILEKLLLSSFAELRKLSGIQPGIRPRKPATKKVSPNEPAQTFPAGEVTLEAVHAGSLTPVKPLPLGTEKKEDAAVHIGA
jgi:diacylglycerol O-acyltransferase